MTLEYRPTDRTLTVVGRAFLDGDWHNASLTYTIEGRTWTGRINAPDGDWVFTDATGHRHAWARKDDGTIARDVDGGLPTLNTRPKRVLVDLEIDEDIDDLIDEGLFDEDTGKRVTYPAEYFCAICEEVIEPGYRDREEAMFHETRRLIDVNVDWRNPPAMLPSETIMWFSYPNRPEHGAETSEIFGPARLIDATTYFSSDGVFAQARYQLTNTPGQRGRIRLVV